jgi:hypothetical protein
MIIFRKKDKIKLIKKKKKPSTKVTLGSSDDLEKKEFLLRIDLEEI